MSSAATASGGLSSVLHFIKQRAMSSFYLIKLCHDYKNTNNPSRQKEEHFTTKHSVQQ